MSKLIVGGSFAKGTWLESDTDIDFFVMIEPKVERKEFEDLGKSVGFHALKNTNPIYDTLNIHTLKEKLMESE